MATPEPHYLTYRAALGAGHLHPGGRRATSCLLGHLDLHDGQRVLEIGCGTGATMAEVLVFRKVSVVGVERLREMVRAAFGRLWLSGLTSRGRVVRGDGAALPFAAATFERAYCESVLGYQHTSGAVAILHEIRRTLRPGGRFVANEAVWRRGAAPEAVAAVNARSLIDFGLRPASAQPWSVDEWIGLIRDAGLNVVSADTLPSDGAASSRVHLRLVLANAYTLFRQARAGLSRELWEQRRIYRRKLHFYRGGDTLLEARLFVVEKPAGRS